MTVCPPGNAAPSSCAPKKRLSARPRPCENTGMDNPLASGPVELFSRIDDYQVDNAAAAANEGIVMTTLDPPCIAHLAFGNAVILIFRTIGLHRILCGRRHAWRRRICLSLHGAAGGKRSWILLP